jgi:lysylphosphatidylglycerol synthetase-like protein (DUF2156 family)
MSARVRAGVRIPVLATLVGLAPAGLFVVASLSADLVAIAGHDPIGIWRVLPFGPVGGSWINAEVSSTTLFLVGITLARAKRIGLWLGLTVLGAGLVVQGLAFHHHPWAIAIAVVFGLILVLTRRRYVARTGSGEAALAAFLLVVGAAAVAIDALAGHGVGARHDGWLVATWLDAGRIGRLSLAGELGILLVVARVALIGASILALDPAADPRGIAEQERSRRVLRQVGRGALLPYQLSSMAVAVADAASATALGYARAGRTAVVLGDAGGPSFDAFLALCRSQDWLPAVYQASSPFASALRGRGWHAIRVGSEALLDPSTFDASSPRLANVRHTVTRARRGGLRPWTSADGAAGLPAAASVDWLASLDAAWQADNGPRLGFTVGQFHPATLGGCVIAAATDAHDRLDAFVVLRPTGADGGWMLDVMRRRRGGTPGAVELCLIAAIEELRSRGVQRLSLGLAPLAGLSPTTGVLAERALALGARLARPVYDVEGLAFFKNKFAPTWEPRFLAVPHVWSLPGAGMALLRLHLGGSWSAVARSVLAPVRPPGRKGPRLQPAPAPHPRER